ncbi:hypothetical protein F5Y16DRAFT_383558 [Xylariaceae sp. FL0255]|nr:hypothetical protein F5Y16DRAFT_383558 [Xylariaceae sp. FL0255]
MVMTNPDGSLLEPGDVGHTDPIIVEVANSCPCDANPKWCCGPSDDHCGEIDFTYGCLLPTSSIHLDLSDIAMGRLLGNGRLATGVIPTQYRRVPCPKPGHIRVWVQAGAGPRSLLPRPCYGEYQRRRISNQRGGVERRDRRVGNVNEKPRLHIFKTTRAIRGVGAASGCRPFHRCSWT